MRKTGKISGSSAGEVIAVSGGPDSVYLICRILESRKSKSAILAHLNHGARGEDSEKDQAFVERLGRSKGMPVEVRTIAMAKRLTGFEKKARNARYAFLRECKEKHGAEKILVAHTADDQVETVLMRVLEGAGIAGLRGIPRKTKDGIKRPILYVWREDILEYLKKHKIPYRVDRSNVDTRFERNWIRHVLIPLLEKRYGKAVKKRIFALGERFREIDRFLETTARKWAANNIRAEANGEPEGEESKPGRRAEIGEAAFVFRRKRYAKLPSELRIRILQILCFEKAKAAPNERLLASMDRLLLAGGASGRLNVGRGAVLACRYDEAVLRIPPKENRGKGRPGARSAAAPKAPGKPPAGIPMDGPGEYSLGAISSPFAGSPPGIFREIAWEEKGRVPPARLRTLCRGEKAAAFDAASLAAPLSVRPLRAGDRIRPFGMEAEKKAKEILIDRKIPREERWGRPVVCDADGRILWIPGVIRSAHAPVAPGTRRTAVLRVIEQKRRSPRNPRR